MYIFVEFKISNKSIKYAYLCYNKNLTLTLGAQ